MSVEAFNPGLPTWKELLPGYRTPNQLTVEAHAPIVALPEAALLGGAEVLDPAPDRTISLDVAERVGANATHKLAETSYIGIDSLVAPESHSIRAEDGVAPAMATSAIASGAIGRVRPIRTAPVRPGVFERATRAWERYQSEPKFGVREATLDDIPAMVDIDMRSFSKVYEGHGNDPEQQRLLLTEMFTHRYLLMGGKWMPVATQRGEDGTDRVVGFMTSCPTSKDPASFTSWEDTTDNGRLDALYDPNGKNVYVVTLSMDPDVKGQRGQNLLFVQQVGTMVSEGLDLAFFESRMPGLRTWVKSQCKADGRDINALSEVEKGALAQEYFGLTRDRNGKQVPYDPLLKVYDGFGCKLLKVLPDAYQDDPSMNFGVLCTFENPTPKWTRGLSLVRHAIGGAIGAVAKSSWLSRKAFG